MAVISPLIRCNLRGTVLGRNWQVGCAFSVAFATPPFTSAQANAEAADVLTRFNNSVWNAATNPLKALNRAYVTLSSCAIDIRDPTGLIQTGFASITPVPGTSSAAASPPDQALVVTLQSGVPGKSNRGRMYLPLTSQPPDGNDGQLLQATCDNVAGRIKVWFRDMFTTPGTLPGAVASRPPLIYSTLHDHEIAVDSIRVDSLIDRQQGRRAPYPALRSGSAGQPWL